MSCSLKSQNAPSRRPWPKKINWLSSTLCQIKIKILRFYLHKSRRCTSSFQSLSHTGPQCLTKLSALWPTFCPARQVGGSLFRGLSKEFKENHCLRFLTVQKWKVWSISIFIKSNKQSIFLIPSQIQSA